MQPDKVLKSVVYIIQGYTKVNLLEQNQAARLEEDLDLDSLDRIQIITDIENQFDIDIPTDVVNKIKTIGDIADAVSERCK